MTKQINLEKYGVDNYSKLPEAILKIKESFIEKYGVDNYVRTEEYKERSLEIQEKIYQTKKRKNSFNYSSDEKLIEQFLIKNSQILKPNIGMKGTHFIVISISLPWTYLLNTMELGLTGENLILEQKVN